MASDFSARVGWRPWRYDDDVASVRLRATLPCERLRSAGVDASIIPAGNDRVGSYDCVVFQKAYTKGDLELARRLRAAGTKLIFDLCDNHFYNPASDPRLNDRARRLAEMIGLCDAVTTPSPALAALVEKPSFLVDDALDIPSPGQRWRSIPGPKVLLSITRRRSARLVWFGNSGSTNPPFGLVHLADVVPELEKLHSSVPLQLTVISNSKPAFRRFLSDTTFPARFVEWRRDTFVRNFQRHQVCVLPVGLNPFTVGKSSNRLVLSLMLGLPVVASELPSYRPFGRWVLFDDWANNVRRYIEDPQLAALHVRDGQDHVRSTYTVEHLVAQWTDAFSAVLAAG